MSNLVAAGVSAGVTQYTGNGKTGDISIPVLGVTVWEFIRELLSIALETILNNIGNLAPDIKYYYNLKNYLEFVTV